MGCDDFGYRLAHFDDLISNEYSIFQVATTSGLISVNELLHLKLINTSSVKYPTTIYIKGTWILNAQVDWPLVPKLLTLNSQFDIYNLGYFKKRSGFCPLRPIMMCFVNKICKFQREKVTAVMDQVSQVSLKKSPSG